MRQNSHFEPQFEKQMRQKLASSLQKGTAISAALIHDGNVVAAAACGWANKPQRVAATVHDLYNVGSISKVYCAAAVMKLVELGLAGLDTPICQYLPQFCMKDHRYRQITLRMCLNHTSGLPGTGMRLAFTSKWMYQEFKTAFIEYLSHATLKAAPGAYSVYCNDGFDLAEIVISQMSQMSYGAFLRQYILSPLNTMSTCTGESNPENRHRVRENGACTEYLNCVGSGGITTDLIACAKFGYLFADRHQGVLHPDSIRDMGTAQEKSFLRHIPAQKYGLGWDSVALELDGYDFGPGTLGKSGGTSQFTSYLLVSPHHHISIALSATKDTGINALGLLAEIAAEYLADKGISTEKALKPAQKPASTPAEDFSGLYYGNRGVYRVTTQKEGLCSEAYSPDGWKPFLTNAVWDGAYYSDGKQRISFERHGETVYLLYNMPSGNMTLAQRFPDASKRPVHSDWLARVGKSYICCDGSPYDLDIGDMVNGVTIRQLDDSGILIFSASEAFGSYRHMPAVTASASGTDTILDGPGSPGSRDTFAPFIDEEGGVAYLYDSGVRYMDVSAVPKLSSGEVTSSPPYHNPVYRIQAGWRLAVEKPAAVRLVMLDQTLSPYYDELRTPQRPETCDGYLMMVSDKPFTAQIVINV